MPATRMLQACKVTHLAPSPPGTCSVSDSPHISSGPSRVHSQCLTPGCTSRAAHQELAAGAPHQIALLLARQYVCNHKWRSNIKMRRSFADLAQIRCDARNARRELAQLAKNSVVSLSTFRHWHERRNAASACQHRSKTFRSLAREHLHSDGAEGLLPVLRRNAQAVHRRLPQLVILHTPPPPVTTAARSPGVPDSMEAPPPPGRPRASCDDALPASRARGAPPPAGLTAPASGKTMAPGMQNPCAGWEGAGGRSSSGAAGDGASAAAAGGGTLCCANCRRMGMIWGRYWAPPAGECSSRSSITHTPMRRSPTVLLSPVSSCAPERHQESQPERRSGRCPARERFVSSVCLDAGIKRQQRWFEWRSNVP